MCAPLSNRLINALSPKSRINLERRLRAVPLPIDTVLFRPGIEPLSIYFLTSGIASVVADMAEGNAVEVGLLGREGLPGSLHLLGALAPSTRCFMQVEGTGLQISFKELMQQFKSDSELHARILQHVQYEALTLNQLSGCNRLHGVQERLARLLLMVSDRVGDDVLPLTQEFLSGMLGTRRPTITVVAGNLQKSGLIEYHRGRIKILNRTRLEHTACECYSTMRQFHRDLYADAITSIDLSSLHCLDPYSFRQATLR